MSTVQPCRRQRGVSLIEALVALAVMAFGMLGVVGMQGSMRLNADIAKQRSEAVRIAQEAVEGRRAFWLLDAAANQKSYADIASTAGAAVLGITSNTTFTVTETASTPPGGGRTKALYVDVTWVDRTGQNQNVRLSTNVTGNMPELSGALGLPALGTMSRLPRGRHAAIPLGATDQGDGTSSFAPPGAGDVSWVFNNVSGFITQSCVATVCSAYNARLLSGYVRFATDSVQPTPAVAESPASVAFAVNVNVRQTFPLPATDLAPIYQPCYKLLTSQYSVYYCALPVDELQGNKWSGRSELILTGISSTIADFDAANYKVCRYTPARDAQPTAPTVSNEKHPYNYADVNTALVNQNFLVIRAGNGATPGFFCPGDDTATPEVNGNTWHHQPAA